MHNSKLFLFYDGYGIIIIISGHRSLCILSYLSKTHESRCSMSNYILPNIKKFDSIKDFMDPENHFNTFSTSINELLKLSNTFIIAEPGFGKTRLLKEIIRLSYANEKSSIFIDLKKVDCSINDFINKKTRFAIEINHLKDEMDLQKCSLIKSSGFELENTSKNIICLDALDEVKLEDFCTIIDSIKEFLILYPNVVLIISCRKNHFKKYQQILMDLNFSYFQIEPFSIQHAKQYLKLFNVKDKNLDKLLKVLKSDSRQSIIQVPRYLQMITTLTIEKGIEYVLDLNKSELFEHFIYNKLQEEGKKVDSQRVDIIKRVLEKLAMVMEIYQSNLISKEELMTFFDDIDSNLSISFLQQVPLEILFDRSLLKDNIDTIEFENTEFQEYLAAKEILRMGKADQIVFDLTIDKNLREIYPSWFNTLKYLIDLDINLLSYILDFGISKNPVVRDEEYHKLITNIEVNRLPIELRKKIFEDIFRYYQSVLHWIDYDISENLSYYFELSQIGILMEKLDEPICKSLYIRKTNSTKIVTHLIKRGILNEEQKQYWKNKLIEFANDENSVLKRYSIQALREFNDISLLKKIVINKIDSSKLEYNELVSSCVEINPNDEYTIKVILYGIERRNSYAIRSIAKINEKKGIIMFFKFLIDDKIDIYKVLSRNFDEEYYISLIENVKKLWDGEIEIELQNFVLFSLKNQNHWYASESFIIKHTVLLLKEKIAGYIFKLILQIKESPELLNIVFSLKTIFSLVIERDDVEKFVKELSSIKDGNKVSILTLQIVKLSNRENSNIIYEEGRKFFKNEYTDAEAFQKKITTEKSETEIIYDDLKYKLEPTEGKYMTDVFSFYEKHKEKLQKLITKEERERLKYLIQSSVFDVFDPGETTLIIEERSKSGMSYTVNSFIEIFGDCILIANDLNINIDKYRQKIINYIPFAFSEHLRAIFSLVPDLYDYEVKKLSNVYSEKRDDHLGQYRPYNFIEACKTYNLTETACNILKKFVVEENFCVYDRISALELVASHCSDKEYLKHIFNQYSSNIELDSYKIAECANEFLISKYSDDEAIMWRLQQLKSRAFKFKEPTFGIAHWVSPHEEELNEKKFAFPLMNLKVTLYVDQYLDLLQFSFEILKKDKDFFPYTKYLWDIVISYISVLKEFKTYTHINKLEKHIEEKCGLFEEVNWLKYKIKEVRRSYISYLGKPSNFASCIKKYNLLKANKYIDISSPEDLKNVLIEIIETDLRNWVENEGSYSYISQNKGNQEALIQKTIKTQFENCMLRRGFRENEVTFIREPQLLDDKRIDILIFYGFIGPILIELKRVDNDEIKNDTIRETYKDKFINSYIKGTKSHYGIFLIFNDSASKSYSLNDYLQKLKETYSDCKNIYVFGLNCIK